MSLPIKLKTSARAEYDEAVEWFEEKWPGKASKFIAAVQSVFERIAGSPEMHSIVAKDVRKAIVPGFRYYVVFYRPTKTRIEVLSIFHTSRDPSVWQDRI